MLSAKQWPFYSKWTTGKLQYELRPWYIDGSVQDSGISIVNP